MTNAMRLWIPIRTALCVVVAGSVTATASADLLSLDDPLETAGAMSLDDPAPAAGNAKAVNAPARGVKLDCYLHYYGETLPQLEAFARDGTPPDISLRLPETRSRNPWNPNEHDVMTRLCGCIMHGWIVPEKEGDYYLIVSESPVPRRLFLSLDGDPAHATEIELVPKSHYNRAEKAVSLEHRVEWETVSRRAFSTQEPLHLEVDQPVYFSLHFLTSYAGEGLDLTWAEVSGENLRRAIPTEVLRPERPKGTTGKGK